GSRFSPKLDFIALGLEGGEVHLLETATGKLRSRLEVFTNQDPGALAFSSDGKWLAVGEARSLSAKTLLDTTTVSIWDIDQQKRLWDIVNSGPGTGIASLLTLWHLEFLSGESLFATINRPNGLSF